MTAEDRPNLVNNIIWSHEKDIDGPEKMKSSTDNFVIFSEQM